MRKNSITYLFLICWGVILHVCSCSSPGKKTAAREEHIGYVKDSISPYGEKIRKFGNDSIYSFDKEDSLSYILYLDTATVIEKIRFEKGRKTYVEYNPFNSEGSMMSEYFFSDTNTVSSRIYMRDTVILTANNPVQCNELIIDYHKNGKIKYFGYQGFYAGQGIPVGVHAEYDSSGYLSKTKDYVYPVQKNDNEISTYIIEMEFHDNGKPKWEKRYTNHVFYDLPEEYKKPTGTWKYYDVNGNVIKMIENPER